MEDADSDSGEDASELSDGEGEEDEASSSTVAARLALASQQPPPPVPTSPHIPKAPPMNRLHVEVVVCCWVWLRWAATSAVKLAASAVPRLHVFAGPTDPCEVVVFQGFFGKTKAGCRTCEETAFEARAAIKAEEARCQGTAATSQVYWRLGEGVKFFEPPPPARLTLPTPPIGPATDASLASRLQHALGVRYVGLEYKGAGTGPLTLQYEDETGMMPLDAGSRTEWLGDLLATDVNRGARASLRELCDDAARLGAHFAELSHVALTQAHLVDARTVLLEQLSAAADRGDVMRCVTTACGGTHTRTHIGGHPLVKSVWPRRLSE